MEKKASVAELVVDRIKMYGPTYFGVGVGLAGLTHLLSLQKAKRDSKKSESSRPVLYLDIPVAKEASSQEGKTKVASKRSPFAVPSASQYFFDAPLVAGTALGSAGVGYFVLDAVLKKIRKQKAEDELQRVKKEYSQLLSQKIYDGTKTASAHTLKYPTIEGLIKNAAERSEATKDKELEAKVTDLVKVALSDPTPISLFTSLPGLGALISGIVAHRYWYNREKDIRAALEKEQTEKAKRVPAQIKIRTVPEDSQEDSQEDSDKKAFLSSGILDDISTIQSISEMAKSKNEDKGKEEEATKDEPRDKQKIFDPSDIEPIDENTIVIRTDDGEVQVDANDPKAIEILNQYSDVIARSLALGANFNKKPVK